MLLAVSICSPGSDEGEKREKQEQMAVTEGAKALFSEGLLSHLTTAVSLATTVYLVPLSRNPVLLFSTEQKHPGERHELKSILFSGLIAPIGFSLTGRSCPFQ